MSSKSDGRASEGPRKEPSLKDALLPATPPREEPAVRPNRPVGPPREGREAASLQEALLPEGHRPSPPPAGALPEASDTPAPHPDGPSQAEPEAAWVIPTIVTAAVAVGLIAIFTLGRMGLSRSNQSAPADAASAPVAAPVEGEEAAAIKEAPAEPLPTSAPVYEDPGPLSLAEIQERGLIIDAHEHIESLEQAPLFLAAMDKLGIRKMCLMGSSKFTLTLNESYGFTEYDENNEELLAIVEAYPGRFEAWPTVNPEDPEKLQKIQDLVSRGASGVKLYIGHGYVSRDHTYMFHTVAMDDPGMLPLYGWCEENYIPVMLHVNPFGDKIGFAQEFIAVLTQYPDLKVIAPHFALSSVYNPRLEELLDTFPNLYSDVSFGDYFMAKRLAYMSKYPKKFRRIFKEYPDRFFFAADLVMIRGRSDDWAPTQMQAYLDMLASVTYTSPAIPGGELTGLNLSDDLVSRVLFRNYEAFRASRPSGTEITREINWERMNQEPIERSRARPFRRSPSRRLGLGPPRARC